jgi:hypothetical protein
MLLFKTRIRFLSLTWGNFAPEVMEITNSAGIHINKACLSMENLVCKHIEF